MFLQSFWGMQIPKERLRAAWKSCSCNRRRTTWDARGPPRYTRHLELPRHFLFLSSRRVVHLTRRTQNLLNLLKWKDSKSLSRVFRPLVPPDPLVRLPTWMHSTTLISFCSEISRKKQHFPKAPPLLQLEPSDGSAVPPICTPYPLEAWGLQVRSCFLLGIRASEQQCLPPRRWQQQRIGQAASMCSRCEKSEFTHWLPPLGRFPP